MSHIHPRNANFTPGPIRLEFALQTTIPASVPHYYASVPAIALQHVHKLLPGYATVSGLADARSRAKPAKRLSARCFSLVVPLFERLATMRPARLPKRRGRIQLKMPAPEHWQQEKRSCVVETT
ncbi:hypothetical protein [Tropicimonas sediminicola]|uniref:hypothetical protein n=1 Tax=Tropicimonas sediminicola TaxID=1031541 RepID=UPI00113004E4|nr:hypothetical protein [Tropicimonas sediminicola]